MRSTPKLMIAILIAISCAISCVKETITSNDKIVMLGDSMTRRIQVFGDNDWNTLLDYDSIYNKGFDAFTTTQILYCCGATNNPLNQAINLNPDVIFVMAGANDMLRNGRISTAMDNLREIVRRIEAEGIHPVIQSVIPTTVYYDTLYGGRPYNGYNSSRINILNDSIYNYCMDNGKDWLDVRYPLVTIGDSIPFLKNEYSTDGVHLTLSGYEEWAKILSWKINSL